MNTRDAGSREAWERWLARFGKTESEIWLVFPKRHTGPSAMSYEEAVCTALCFGWIDSLVRRVDDDRYARKFTPRKPESRWSAANRHRAEAMIRAGRMRPEGMALVESAKATGRWEQALARKGTEAAPCPDELAAALAENPAARATFDSLPPSARRNCVRWVGDAKRTATRERRAREAVARLARGERLGLK